MIVDCRHDFARKLRMFRAAHDLYQKDLAALSGLDASTISRFERPQGFGSMVVTTPTLRKLADAMDVSVEDLVTTPESLVTLPELDSSTEPSREHSEDFQGLDTAPEMSDESAAAVRVLRDLGWSPERVAEALDLQVCSKCRGTGVC